KKPAIGPTRHWTSSIGETPGLKKTEISGSKANTRSPDISPTRRTIMRQRLAALSLVVVIVLSFSSLLLAQSATGQINGTVIDASGAVVSGAMVTITNQGTRISNRSTTNGSGNFLFLNVQPGVYSLAVEKTGFKKMQTAPFDLAVNQTLTQPVT